ncbi:protein ALP1-like [Odontomachus brunneus]|uniref:protein ALP1-like n=1 Tax=Odontomachus brunneus TaxID=486640 RepID=UPI0013F2ACD3|nr:protein ALP1-like [Odontomachus brunneus]
MITPDMSEKIHDIMLDDPKMKLRKLTAAVSTSSERVFNTLHKHLGYYINITTVLLVRTRIEQRTRRHIINLHVRCSELVEDWIETFRMTKETFFFLGDELREQLAPNINQIETQEPVSVEKQVAVCLYFLSSCEYRIVGNNFGIHKATVWKCIHKVIDAINAELMSSCITMPDKNECHKIATVFEKKTHIPQLIGAIDGTHVPILPPSDGYRDYINRKGWPSIILQAVVDHNYRFRNIYCGTPGSCHDAAVFQTSQLYKNYNLLIPEETKTVLNVSVPYLIIGDPAYPLLEWLIKGYTKSARLTPEEESFNVYLNSARVCVEIAFGRLKARWRRLLKRIDVYYTYVPHIVSAACILHNIVET